MSGLNQIANNYESNDYVENKDVDVESTADIPVNTKIEQPDIDAISLLKETYEKADSEGQQQLNDEFNKFTPEINEILLGSSEITEHDINNVKEAKNLRYVLEKYPNLSPVARNKIETFAQKQAELQKGEEEHIRKAIDQQNQKEKNNEDIE